MINGRLAWLFQGAWCVAKPSASDDELQNNIAYACNYADCKVIQQGGSCYEPQKLVNHASVAMNLYYQASGRNYWNCDFNQSGIVAVTDPSMLLIIFFSLTIMIIVFNFSHLQAMVIASIRSSSRSSFV